MTIRELRHRGGDVVDRVAAGESVRITRDGRPVAELLPLPRAPLDAATLLQRWRRLPAADATAFRADIDEALDTSL